MVNPVYPAINNAQAIDLNISNANQFFTILQGDITDSIPTYNGNGEIPSVAKALYEAAAYKTPLPWETTGTQVDLLQTREYLGSVYAPIKVPAEFSTAPTNEFWRVLQVVPVSNNISATEDPTASDSISNGYGINSIWINQDTSEVFRCIDNTAGTAVWVKTTLTVDELGVLAIGDSASDVPYDNSGNSLDALDVQTAIDTINNPVEYAAGVLISSHHQFVEDTSGEFWRVSGSTSLPYTTTGAGLPEGGAFVAVGDAALRQELATASVGQGSDQVAHVGTTDTVTEALNKRVIYVGSVAELEAVTTAPLDGVHYEVTGYNAGSDIGGGIFYWDASSTELINGVTVFKPTAIATGRFKRLERLNLSAYNFGLKEAGTSSENQVVYSLVIDYSQSTGAKIKWPAGTYDLGAIEKGYDCDKPLRITGDGKSRTIFTGTGQFLRGTNTAVLTTSLSASVGFQDTEIAVASVTGVTPGMLMVIRSNEQFEETERSGTKDAAFMVKAVKAGSVVVESYARFTFDSAAVNTVSFFNVQPLELIDFSIEFNKGSVGSAILIDNGANITTRLRIKEASETDRRGETTSLWYMGIQINRSANITHDHPELSFLTYGLYSVATSNVRINSPKAYFCRHLNNQALGSADTIITNGKADNCFAGFDSHQEAMDSYFYNCESTNDTVASKMRGRFDVVDGGYYEKLSMRADTGLVGDTFTNRSEFLFIKKVLKNVRVGIEGKQYFGEFQADDGIFANVVEMENVTLVNHGWSASAGYITIVKNFEADYRNVTYGPEVAGDVLPSGSETLTLDGVRIYGNTAGVAPNTETTLSGFSMNFPFNLPELYVNNFVADGLSRLTRFAVGGSRPQFRVLNGKIENCDIGIMSAVDIAVGAIDNIQFSGNNQDLEAGKTFTKSVNSFTL